MYTFRCFAFVAWTVYVLATLVEGDVDVDNSCKFSSNYVSYLTGVRCCAGQMFTYTALRPQFQHCSRPPIDPAESTETSYWRLVQCLVTKSVDINSIFTLSNFGDKLTTNLTSEAKQKILALLKDKDLTISTDKSPEENLSTLKSMWTNYFDAELQVCKGNLTKDEVEAPPRTVYYAPQQSCKNNTEVHPRILVTEWTVKELESCLKDFLQRYDFNSFDRQVQPTTAGGVCVANSTGVVKENDLKQKLDLTSILQKMLPQFLSKSTHEKIVKFLPGSMSIEFNIKDGDDLPKVISKVMERSRETVKAVQSRKESDDFYINCVTIGEIFGGIWRATEALCDGKASRN